MCRALLSVLEDCDFITVLGIIVKIIVVYDLWGSKSSARVLCFIAKSLRADVLVLLGNTISPVIIEWLISSCNLHVLGVLSKYDSAAVAVALSRRNSLLECKSVEYSGIRLLGIGVSGCQQAELERADIVFSSLPGLRYTCCYPRSDRIDAVIESVKPKLVVTGECEKPCFTPNTCVFSPGSVKLGFLGLLEISASRELQVHSVNIEKLLVKLA